jgi:archaellum component FlaC
MVELRQQRDDLDESLRELQALEAIALKGLEQKGDVKADIDHIIRQRPTSGRRGQLK